MNDKVCASCGATGELAPVTDQQYAKLYEGLVFCKGGCKNPIDYGAIHTRLIGKGQSQVTYEQLAEALKNGNSL
jgi:hypothetical protein